MITLVTTESDAHLSVDMQVEERVHSQRRSRGSLLEPRAPKVKVGLGFNLTHEVEAALLEPGRCDDLDIAHRWVLVLMSRPGVRGDLDPNREPHRVFGNGNHLFGVFVRGGVVLLAIR